MGDFLVFERFVWFDAQVRQKRFPNATKLADHFELSRKTAQRNNSCSSRVHKKLCIMHRKLCTKQYRYLKLYVI
jgi:hypothetical protein